MECDHEVIAKSSNAIHTVGSIACIAKSGQSWSLGKHQPFPLVLLISIIEYQELICV
jgi:hypothetical protein